MSLDGKDYLPGDNLPQSVVELIRPGRLGSMVRLRHLEEVTASQAAAARQPKSGDICPECGGGPYKNLKGHTTKMHMKQEA